MAYKLHVLGIKGGSGGLWYALHRHDTESLICRRIWINLDINITLESKLTFWEAKKDYHGKLGSASEDLKERQTGSPSVPNCSRKVYTFPFIPAATFAWFCWKNQRYELWFNISSDPINDMMESLWAVCVWVSNFSILLESRSPSHGFSALPKDKTVNSRHEGSSARGRVADSSCCKFQFLKSRFDAGCAMRSWIRDFVLIGIKASKWSRKSPDFLSRFWKVTIESPEKL